MMAAFIVLLLVCVPACLAKPPNIVLILADDQDTVLGGMKPMTKARELIGKQGATFKNAFVTTPVCCPSRASMLTGLYLHNHGTVNNSVTGGCNSRHWQAVHEHNTYAAYLKSRGYDTMYAGKYLNTYGFNGDESHVPPGWDWWIGLVGNSKYYDYTLSVNGTAVHHGEEYAADYLTDVINRYAMDFLDQKSARANPFLMVLSVPAPHAPFTPAPQFNGTYSDVKAPRFPNFNSHSEGKHWLVRMQPNYLSNTTVNLLDEIYQHRLETLLSVDKMVEDVVNKLNDLGALDDTYIMYTSDHGFHIGQFGLPWDKRQPYEFDLRIPLMIRGPNIYRNRIEDTPVLNIDVAPTILDMASVEVPDSMDGSSVLSFVTAPQQTFKARTFLVEYRGEGNAKSNSRDCPSSNDDTLSECSDEAECKCQDARNNTYNCIRHLSSSKNMVYCEFFDSEKFVELYDLQADPYQLHNIAESTSKGAVEDYHKCLKKLSVCSGVAC